MNKKVVAAGLRLTLALVVVLPALWACGGSGSPSATGSPGDGSAGGACSITLSGMVTGTYACDQPNVTAGWSSANNTGALPINYGMLGQTNPAVVIALGWPGEPHSGSFTSADSGAMGGVTVSNPGGYWAAVTGGNGTPPQGTYTLNLGSVSAAIASPDGKVYMVHGTLDATLPPLATGAGTVSLHASF